MLKKLHYILLLVVLSIGQQSMGQSIMSCPPVGTTNTLTQCGGQYADPGGNGNYGINLNCTQTICPSTAGQCVTLQFTGGQLETTFDVLTIYNGTSATGVPLATLSGTIAPQNVTSTSGCLTLVFQSDGSVNYSGWLANVICNPCGTPPPPPPGPVIASDCSGAVNICTNATFQIDPSGSGNVVEFVTGTVSNPSTNVASGNQGCLLSGELNSTWMVVNVATNGTLEFSFGTPGNGCLDWIMWPYNGPATCTQIINNTLAPVRCNWNANCINYTGMATPVPANGFAGDFEPELNVTCGQRYLICLSNYSSQTTSVPLNFFGTASVSCVTVTPVTVNSATICAGQSATLTATGANTYTWTPPTGLSATTGATVTASPATTTTYTVTGVGSCGTSSATSTVTVNAASATAANTGPYCIGSTIQLNGTGPAGATYAWTGPNGFTSAVQNPTLPATAAAAGTYTLTTSLGGCTATATTTVAVNAVATVNANTDQTICAGGTVTLAGTVGGSATSGTWSAAGGTFSNPASLTSTYTPAITTGTITLTLTTNDPTGPCPAVTDQMVITVTPGPSVNAGPDQTLCSGPNVTLSATGATTYTWTPSVSNGVPFAPTIGSTTYTVVGTTAGCTGTDQVVVTVNQTPTIVTNDVSVCAAGTVSLTATGGNTYSWSPSTSLSASTGATVLFTPGVTTTYTVTGTSAQGCTSSDPVTVTVVANAPINAGLDVILCAGAQATITASGGLSYTWSPSAGLSSTTGAVIIASPTVTTTYTLTGVDANGCSGTDQVTIVVNANPIVNAGADQTVCSGTPITLSATGANTYSWSPTATNGVPFTPTTTATYTVSGTTNGCIGVDDVLITVNPVPIVNAGADQTLCQGPDVTLTATGASTYTWTPAISNGVTFTPTLGATTYTVVGTTNGCTATDQVVVTINPIPTVSAGPDQTICDGTNVTLTASGANTYTWAPSITNGAPFTPSIGSTTYSVTGTTAAGCSASDQVVVTVNPNPAPIIQGATTYCVGFPPTLSTSTPFDTYSWSTGVGTPTASVTEANNPITVTVTNGFGCSGTSPAFNVTLTTVINTTNTITLCQGESAVIHGITQTVSGVYAQTFPSSQGCDSTSTVTLIVNPLPSVNAGIDQTVCSGTQITLNATGAATYTWSPLATNGVPFTQAVGSTTYTVTGTSAAGCINTDQVVVTVNPLPTVNAGNDVAICIGQTVTLTGAGATTYSWTAPVQNGVPFSPSTTATYTLTGTSSAGCTSTDQVLVTVNPLPTVTAGNDISICVGATVTLSAGGAATYSWSAPVQNGVPFSPTTTATYTVTGTSAAGCTNTDQVLVTVNSLPTVTAGNDVTICAGASVTLSGGGATTYSWSPAVTNGISFTPAVGTTTYTVTGTASGCTNTDQVVVTVNPLPIVSAGQDLSICAGQQVTLNATGALNYSWSGGVVNGIPFTPNSTSIYTVTGTSNNGCVATDQVLVTVNPIPNVFAGNDVVTCPDQTVVLTGSGAATYTWSPTVVNGVAFVPTLGVTTYTVTGTSAAGCTNTDQVVVTVNDNLAADFIPSVTTGCAPLTVTFTNNTANSFDCVWTMSDGTVLNGCNSVTNTFEQPGCYDITLTVTSSQGCVTSFTQPDLICVDANPIASFMPSAWQISELDMEVIFNNTSDNATQYIWNFGDTSPLSDVESPTHDYTGNEIGTYDVTLIAISPAGCTDTAYATIQIYEEVIFYVPNTFTPDNDTYNQTFKPIFTSGYDPFDYSLYIYDRWGEIIFESHNTEVGWNGTYGSNQEIDMVQDGTYTWKIEFKVTKNDERRMQVGHVNVIR